MRSNFQSTKDITSNPAYGKQVFDETVHSEEKNNSIFQSYIRAMGELGDLDEAKRAYSSLVKANLVTVHVCTTYIATLYKAQRFAEAKEVFNSAHNNGMVNSSLYETYISEAGSQGDLNEAQRAFNHALTKEMVTGSMYCTYILAAYRTNNHEQVKTIFDDACRQDMDNPKLYEIYIKIAASENIKNLSEATRAFNLARKKGRSDERLHKYYTNMEKAIRSGNFYGTRDAFMESKSLDRITRHPKKTPCLFSKAVGEAPLDNPDGRPSWKPMTDHFLLRN